MKFYWPDSSGGQQSWTCNTPIYSNIWYSAIIHHQGANIWIDMGWQLPDGSSGSQNLAWFTTGRTTDMPVTFFSSGTGGGNYVKLYLGEISYLHSYTTVIWQETFESGGLTGYTLYYTEPSYVHVDNVWVYDNGPNWMLQQIKS
jgi:hypothetical protein